MIGCSAFAGAKCLSWGSLRTVPNIADYQTVVVATGALIDHINRLKRLRDEIDNEDGRKELEDKARGLSNDLALLRYKLLQVLRARGEVYAVIHPCTRMFPTDRRSGYCIIDSDECIPLPVVLHEEPGEGPRNILDGYERYFALVPKWTHVFGDRYQESEIEYLVEDEIAPAPKPQLNRMVIATDWQGNAIGQALSYSLHSPNPGIRQSGEDQPQYTSGYFFILPPPHAKRDEEAVRLLLEDFCGIESRSPDPPWITEVSAPGEPEAVAALKSAEATLTGAQQSVDAAAADVEKTASYKRVLSQKGPVLQEAVREIFESMGIQADDSPVSDEFVLVDSQGKVLVEVTGSDRSVSTRDLSQLIKDIGKYVEATGEGAKGLFIANPWKDIRPGERDTKDKPIFPDDLVKTARPFSISLLSTIELFNAYCSLKEGKLTVDALMLRIRDTTGVVRLT